MLDKHPTRKPQLIHEMQEAANALDFSNFSLKEQEPFLMSAIELGNKLLKTRALFDSKERQILAALRKLREQTLQNMSTLKTLDKVSKSSMSAVPTNRKQELSEIGKTAKSILEETKENYKVINTVCDFFHKVKNEID